MIVFAITGSLAACSAAPMVNAAAATDANTSVETVAGNIASPAQSAADALRGAIQRHFPDVDVRLKQKDRAGSKVANLIKTRVDPALTRGAIATEAHDLQFSGADGVERHAGVFFVRFADAATATARSAKLVARRNAFLENTVILSPMVAARAGSVVAIFYSESGGDPRMRDVLTAAALAFGDVKPVVRE